ncbi:MAG: DUF4430 domain-containing protein [Clostridia bacterium]|nr:DUF4430 domain-containing protein [Clostridia bacterium]
MRKIISVTLAILMALSSLMLSSCETKESGKSETFSIKISCETVLENKDKLPEEKRELVPENGIFYENDHLEFSQGQTLYQVLKTLMQKEKIHIDFNTSNSFGSVYVRGIGNIYELDCGNLSGWFMKINGEFPNEDCGSYKVKQGDIVEFLYTCNMGEDL